MKKILGILFVLTVCLALAPAGANAQTPSKGLQWNASPSAGVTGYNIYRAPCTGTITGDICSAAGAFAKLNATPVSGLTYTDTTVTAGLAYAWRATAFCPTCAPSESVPSNTVGAMIMNGQPQPPGNLTFTSSAAHINKNETTIQASWTGGPVTSYTLVDNKGKLLQSGLAESSSGRYFMSWEGKKNTAKPITLQVCEPTGGCTAKVVGS